MRIYFSLLVSYTREGLQPHDGAQLPPPRSETDCTCRSARLNALLVMSKAAAPLLQYDRGVNCDVPRALHSI